MIRSGRIVADRPTRELLAAFSEDRYRVEIEGDGVPDAAWLGDRLRDQGLKVKSVEPVEPDLEDVFVRLVDEG